MQSVKEKEKKAYDALKGTFGYTNVMQSPRIVKVVVTSGVGSMKDKNKEKIVVDRLARITGQRQRARPPKNLSHRSSRVSVW